MGEALLEALAISGKCLLGIFIVIAIVFIAVQIMNWAGRPRNKKEEPEEK